jgi:hypothetical protein
MSTIKTETLSTPSNATVPVDTVVNGTAKAWVNFNGTSTVAIRRAFNVASITDHGLGQYSCNFTNTLVDGDYSVQITVGRSPNVAGTYPPFGYMADDQAVPTTSSFRLLVKGETSSLQDQDRVFIAVFS